MYWDLVNKNLVRHVNIVARVRANNADAVCKTIELPELYNVRVSDIIVDYGTLCAYYAGYLLTLGYNCNMMITVVDYDNGNELFNYHSPEFRSDLHKKFYRNSVINAYNIICKNMIKEECNGECFEWSEDIKYVNSEGVCIEDAEADSEKFE